MAKLDHDAIFKAYPEVGIINDETGAFKEDGTQVNLVQSDIDAARIELNKLKYQKDRTIDGSTVYASIGDQLDMLYKDIVAGKLDTTGTWATHIKAVKDANPKP
tara:strand:+ start:275 stop:586 length:312 start_codon:yes stop_codon:yes gene_type:complete